VLSEEDPAIKAWLSKTIPKVLTRDDERALFGLAPLPPEPSAPQKADAARPGGERPGAQH
jgi:hypothetical protein